MKYTPCEHSKDTCDSCALMQAEARIALLEGMLCKVHEDCREHPLLGATCSKASPPQVGDIVIWLDGPSVAIVDRVDGDSVYGGWLRPTREGRRFINAHKLTILKRAEPKP